MTIGWPLGYRDEVPHHLHSVRQSLDLNLMGRLKQTLGLSATELANEFEHHTDGDEAGADQS